MQSHIHKPKDLKITHMGGTNCGTIMINHEYMKHLPKKIITGQHFVVSKPIVCVKLLSNHPNSIKIEQLYGKYM